MFADALDLEIGITHPAYLYASSNCGEINNCFQEVLFLNAGYPSYIFGVPGGNIKYQITPNLYIQGGAFALEPNANLHLGYDFIDRSYNGVLTMQEIGFKTDFSHDAYPYKISLTSFVNTVPHLDRDAASANGTTARSVNGTSGLVVMGDKTIWRKDEGADLANTSPTSLKIYGSAGLGLDTTMPIHSDVFVGATLLAPFADRPNDTYGLKVMWERLNSRYERYLTEANHVSGGTATPYSQDTFIFELNAHFQLPMGIIFEPTVQYAVDPNSYYNPFTSRQAKDGVYVAGTVVIPIGKLLGL
jgi:porin